MVRHIINIIVEIVEKVLVHGLQYVKNVLKKVHNSCGQSMMTVEKYKVGKKRFDSEDIDDARNDGGEVQGGGEEVRCGRYR